MDCFDSAFSVFSELRKQRKRLITAESLTGGLIAAEFTRVPGASEVFWGSFAAYTPEAKISLLSVAPSIIEKYGVVSVQTAEAMAQGALQAFLNTAPAEPACAVAVTGLAGPGGGSADCPVGTVCFALACTGSSGLKIVSDRRIFSGARDEVRKKTVSYAFSFILKELR